MSSPAISVIIPTKGRDSCLRQVLRDLDAQVFKDFDVWVVDQNDKKLSQLEAEVRTIKIHHESMPPLGSHAGRNHAIGRTRSRICLFVDDDVRIEPYFVGAHFEAINAEPETTAVIAGRVIQPKDGLSEEQMIRFGRLARYSALTGSVSGNFIGTERGYVDHMHECNFSARTKLLVQVGAFNEEFKGNAYFEGTDLSLRLIKHGCKILYRPDVSLVHLQDGLGGNRVHEKAGHTYWMMRNQSLLNSAHMNKIGIPYFELSRVLYVLAKSLKNRNTDIAREGFRGLKDGLQYFLGRRPKNG